MKTIAWIFLFALMGYSYASEKTYPAGVCRETLERHVREGVKISIQKSDSEEKSRPLFVTLRKNGRTRGCAGAFQPQFSSLEEELAYFTVNAAEKDFRYRPVKPEELKDIVIIITFPKELRAVQSISQYNPWKHGLLVRKDGKEGVILPCEGKTSSYAVKKAVLQSGIDDIEGADIYIFDCETITETK
jgi:AMMECR1 domain-containing protein